MRRAFDRAQYDGEMSLFWRSSGGSEDEEPAEGWGANDKPPCRDDDDDGRRLVRRLVIGLAIGVCTIMLLLLLRA